MRAALSGSPDGPAVPAEVTVSLEPAGSSWAAAETLAALAETLGGIPRVLLRDTDGTGPPGPVIQPASPEMPELADRSAHLQLFGEIARGGMGAVLKGRDVDLGRDLAVKVLLEKHRDNPDLARRFIEEAQIAGQLQHPGVVPVYELGAFADRRPYFAMKLVKGRTLATILAERADPAEGLMGLLGTMLQVGQTVAFAHARGVIHRDLKPSNVMVGSFGEVQVMDWGLAKVLPKGGAADDEGAGRDSGGETVIATARSGSDSDLSQAGSVLGTPAYMAPEQARGEVDAVDERADVFALGSMLCEVLTGRPAFTGRDSAEILRRAGRGELADVWSRLDAVAADGELIALARDCLAPERAARPRAAPAFVERLNGYLASIEQRLRAAELELAAEFARAEEAARRAAVERQRRRYQVGLAASLLALSVVGGLSFTFWTQQRQAREARVALAWKEATLLRDQATRAPEDVARWEAAAKGLADAERASVEAGDPETPARLSALRGAINGGLADARRDRALVEAVARVRTNKGDLGRVGTDAAYSRAFMEAGLDVNGLPPAEVGAALAKRPAPVVSAAAAALDDWSLVRNWREFDEQSWRRVLEVARAADRDPGRDRVRAALLGPRTDSAKSGLLALARDPEAGRLPPPTAVLLAAVLRKLGAAESGVALLRDIVIRHPDDVWLNHSLAEALMDLRPAAREEALRYYSMVRALQPKAAIGLAHLLDWMGRGDEALALFADLDARSPDNPSILCYYGNALKERGRPEAAGVFDRAIAASRAAVQSNPDDIEARHNASIALKGRNRLEEAVAEYREVIRLRPNYAEAHSGLADVLAEQGKLDEAVLEYRAALRLKPDDASSHTNLGSALERLGRLEEAIGEVRAGIRVAPHLAYTHAVLGKALHGQRKLTEAVAEYREAIRLMPDLAMIHNNLGTVLDDQGKYQEAFAAFQEAIRLRPGLAMAHCNLGANLFRQKKFDVALAELRESIRLEPLAADYRGNLGAVLLELGKLDEAIAEIREAMRLRPDRASDHKVLGNALLRQRKPEEAAGAFREAIRLTPDDADAHFGLGNAVSDQGKLEEGAVEFREAVRLKPDFEQAHYNLGTGLAIMKREEEAIVELREAIRLNPDNPPAYNNLGNALRMLGRPAEAIAVVREATRRRPQDPDALYILGLALTAHWKAIEAADALREAIRLEPDDPGRRRTLAKVLLGLGELKEAEDEFRALVERKSRDPEDYYLLAVVLMAKGNYDAALVELRRVQELASGPGGRALRAVDSVRSAERLVACAEHLPALLKGDKPPGDAVEALALARFDQDRAHFATSADCYERAFVLDPTRAEDLDAGDRYNAACAAALAGAGQGRDDPALDGGRKAILRRRALAWLRADLERRSRQLARGNDSALALLRNKLKHWKRDPDLAGVRDGDALANLPEGERTEWRAFWVEVDQMVGQSEKTR
jgi:serine/threonine-protein kinase